CSSDSVLASTSVFASFFSESITSVLPVLFFKRSFSTSTEKSSFFKPGAAISSTKLSEFSKIFTAGTLKVSQLRGRSILLSKNKLYKSLGNHTSFLLTVFISFYCFSFKLFLLLNNKNNSTSITTTFWQQNPFSA